MTKPVRIPGATRGINRVSATITRPADTTQYTIGDAIANSASTPTEGGFTLANVLDVAGRSARLMDLMVVSSNPADTPLEGQVWLFTTAVTAINDNAAFAISDAEALTLLGIVPFTLVKIGNNSLVTVATDLGITTATRDIRFLLRATNAYTPASGETITVIGKFHGLD